MSAPNAEFPALLAGIGTQIVRDGFTDPTRPIGTGAFRFVSFDAGRSMVASRYDDYWDDPARIDELHILSADAEARANAVQGGQAEYANDMTATFARTAEAGKTVRIVAAKASTMQAFVMKCDQPPFDNPDVRMAFKLLADRQRLVDVVLAGRGAVGNDLFGKGYPVLPGRPAAAGAQRRGGEGAAEEGRPGEQGDRDLHRRRVGRASSRRPRCSPSRSPRRA